MTKFLIMASMLFASAVFAQVEIPHVHENGDVIDADEINKNLDIVAKAVPPRDCSTNQIIKWNGSAWVCSSLERVTRVFDPVLSRNGGTVNCPTGKTVTGGGCQFGEVYNCAYTVSRPNDLSGWYCGADGGICEVSEAFAICQ